MVPVLRAGLGMLGGVLRHLPETDTGFIGLARNEETYLPEPYMNSVPDELDGRPVLVLDPMLATGGSLDHSCRMLADHGAGPLTAVCVLAAPEGVARLEASGLVAHVVTASIDERLNDQRLHRPGPRRRRRPPLRHGLSISSASEPRQRASARGQRP